MFSNMFPMHVIRTPSSRRFDELAEFRIYFANVLTVYVDDLRHAHYSSAMSAT